MVHDQIDSHEIVCSSRDDDVRILFGRKTELLKGRLHKGDVLVQNLLQLSASLTDVPQHSSREARVWVRVHKQLHLEQISNLLRVEHENPLEENHIRWIHGHKLILPGMGNKIINWDVHSGPLNDVAQSLHDELIVESIWVIEVKLALECFGLLFRRELPVKAVLTEDDHLPLMTVNFILAQQLHDLLTY